jgi:hypothetical protein
VTEPFATAALPADDPVAVLTPAGWIDGIAACTDDMSLWDDEDVLRRCAPAVPNAVAAAAECAA